MFLTESLLEKKLGASSTTIQKQNITACDGKDLPRPKITITNPHVHLFRSEEV